MNRRLFLIASLLCFNTALAAPAKPMRVLFVGNSYTYANGMPHIVAALAKAAKGRSLEFEMVTKGGFTFQRHFEQQDKKSARARIRDGKWDFVVLQEQSQMPVMYPKVTIDWGTRLAKEVKAAGATPVFFMTWARQHIPDQQEKLNAVYSQLAKDSEGKLAPVGLAWQSAFKLDSKRVLHNKDKSHPNKSGSYLAACVIYSTLYDKSLQRLPGTLIATVKGKRGVLIKIPTSEAVKLQKIAWETVSKSKSKSKVKQ